MNSKLTLSIDQVVIEQAKAYAEKNNTSVSNLVENYLASISNKKKNSEPRGISPLVKSLSGVLKAGNIVFEEQYSKFLKKKYK